MITFGLIAIFFLLIIAFALIAYTSNNRKRASMKGTPSMPTTGHDGSNAQTARATGSGN